MFNALALTQPATLPWVLAISTKTQPPSTETTRTAVPAATGASTDDEASFSALNSAGRLTVAFCAVAPMAQKAKPNMP
jgi:hypothetical protein